jgi:hypothetical protein
MSNEHAVRLIFVFHLCWSPAGQQSMPMVSMQPHINLNACCISSNCQCDHGSFPACAVVSQSLADAPCADRPQFSLQQRPLRDLFTFCCSSPTPVASSACRVRSCSRYVSQETSEDSGERKMRLERVWELGLSGNAPNMSIQMSKMAMAMECVSPGLVCTGGVAHRTLIPPQRAITL